MVPPMNWFHISPLQSHPLYSMNNQAGDFVGAFLWMVHQNSGALLYIRGVFWDSSKSPLWGVRILRVVNVPNTFANFVQTSGRFFCWLKGKWDSQPDALRSWVAPAVTTNKKPHGMPTNQPFWVIVSDIFQFSSLKFGKQCFFFRWAGGKNANYYFG